MDLHQCKLYTHHQYVLSVYLSGTFSMRQHGGFWDFCWGLLTFGPMCQHFVPLGGVCVYFLKSVRKGRFRSVWVGAG